MEKEENPNSASEDQKQDAVKETEKPENSDTKNKKETNQEPKEEIKEITPEEKIIELEDKITRTFAEMENQRRRFEKEKRGSI